MTRPVNSARRRGGSARRDAGLANLRLATRWVTLGAVGLAAVLTAVVAQALPGSSRGANGTPTPTTSTAVPDAPRSAGSAAGTPALQPSAQAPVAAAPTTQAPVVSGGS